MSSHKARRPTWALVASALAVALVPACIPAPPPGTSSSPSGRLDTIQPTAWGGSVRVTGWAADWDTTDPVDLAVMVNGQWVLPPVNLGIRYARELPAFSAQQYRPDVNAAFGIGDNHGFDIEIDLARPGYGQDIDFEGKPVTVPNPYLGPVTVCVAALNKGIGANTLLGCDNTTITMSALSCYWGVSGSPEPRCPSPFRDVQWGRIVLDG